MSLLSTLLRRGSAEKTGEIVRYTLSDYLQQRVQAIGSMMFPGYATTATVGGRPVEQIENSYTGYVNGAYKNDTVVAACMRVRRDIFRQAHFCWREFSDSGLGRSFITEDLRLLEHPWPNGTSHELLTRMITDVDLCGNSYLVQDGDRLRWLRPDWVSIILSADPEIEAEVDVKGYVYTPGGGNLEDGTVFLPTQVCHWSPIPDPIAQYRGMSWLTPAIREVQADIAATDHKLMFFRNGATMGPIFTLPKEISVEQFKDFVAAADAAHVGVQNAYRPVYVGGGAAVTMGAATMQQLEFKATQGAGETRIAALAGVHPVLVGLSEGLAGSSLNAGNFNSARRSTADVTMWPLWQDACNALEAFLDVPPNAELWIQEQRIPFLREDAKDQAEITKTKMLGIEAGVRAGFKPDALVTYFDTHDITVLRGQHTGLTSVQLLPPGSSPEDQAGAEDEYEAALEEARAVFGPDDDLERRYNRNQARIPKGFEGGGRFRDLSDRLIKILKDWLKDPDDSDPLEEFDEKPRQLREVAKELGLLRPRQRATVPQLKTMLLKHARGDKTPDVDEPEKPTPTKAAPRKRAPAFDAAKVAGQVASQKTEADVIKLLSADPNLTAAKLRKVAEHLGIDVPENVRAKSALQLLIAENEAKERNLPGGFDAPKAPAKKATPAPRRVGNLATSALADPENFKQRPIIREPDTGDDEPPAQGREALLELLAGRDDGISTAAVDTPASVLRELHADGLITIHEVTPDLMGTHESGPLDPARFSDSAARRAHQRIRLTEKGRQLASPDLSDKPQTGEAPAKKAARTPLAPGGADDIAEEFYREKPTEQQILDRLDGLNLAELKKVARAIPVPLPVEFHKTETGLTIQTPKKLTADELRRHIAATIVKDRKQLGAGAPARTDLTPEDQARVRRLIRRDPVIFATVQDRFGGISTSGNLSDEDAAWLQSIHKRDRAFVEREAQDAQIKRTIAEKAKKAGQTPGEYKTAAAARLKEWLDGKPVAVRVRDDAALKDILAGGRFKTSLEGAKRGPHLEGDPDRRKLGEHILGTPPDAPMDERPIYGYVAVDGIQPALSPGKKIPGIAQREGQEDVLSSYGQIQVVLKPDVRPRTTATVGDSLDEIGFMRPTPIDNPTAESLGFRDLDSVTKPGWTRQGYVEAQIHGGVKADDIDEVVFPSPPSETLKRQLDDKGISWRVLSKDSPPDLSDKPRTGDKPTTAEQLAKKSAEEAAVPDVDIKHTVADLRLIAKQRGVKIQKGTKKAELLALLGLTRSAMAYFDDDYEYDEDEISRALDREQLHHFWTRDPEGLAKWVGHPHPWTALRNHLRKYVGQARADRMASEWFHEVFGIWSGERKGKNPVGPG